MAIEIIWGASSSCCGSHRSGDGVFPDGERLSVYELDHGARYSVRVLKGGRLNTASTRVPGGENMNMGVVVFQSLIEDAKPQK